MNDSIRIKGAREHNLKNINLDIPKNKIICFTGVSGSGKSSLAFDTIYAEGQRRYVESLSSYARQFLGIMQKPDVDLIEGLSPSISIDQKTVSHNPRSTVGTVTEIYDYLRLLFARIGHPHCPICGDEISTQSIDQITHKVLNLITKETKSKKTSRLLVLSPVVKGKKGEFDSLFENLRSKGISKARIDGSIKNLSDDFVLIKTNKHTIEAVIDRISASQSDISNPLFTKNLKSRLTDSLEKALELSNGLVIVALVKDNEFIFPEFPKDFSDHLFSEKFSCPNDNIELPEIEPRTFSFNSPHGACPRCSGLGTVQEVDPNLILAPEINIFEGGVTPFATIFEHDTWFSRLILEVFKAQNIDPHKPIKNFSDQELGILLNGTGKKMYTVPGNNKQGKLTQIQRTFDGVIGELNRHYQETSSDYIRSWVEHFMKKTTCPDCQGARLKRESLGITIDQKSISEISDMTIENLIKWTQSLQTKDLLSQREIEIAKLILKEVITRLKFLDDVGLNYLTLSRSANTLSGGEAQRIRLASQIGTGLSGVLYVLDEPTIGLHPRDNEKLITTLKNLKDLGNTVIVVEHDRDVMLSSDLIVDFGPKAGKNGGGVVAKDTPTKIQKDKYSLTGKYLSGKKQINFPKNQQASIENNILSLQGASAFNLKNIDVDFPLGKFIAITGVSGSGKSTLAVEVLYHALAKNLNRYHNQTPGDYKNLLGLENIDKTILIDQSPIGRTPRSNPATYTKVFDLIRDVYASTRDARAAGYKKGRFSFNVKGGRCEACQGQGKNKIEMQFMPDIWVTCEICKGTRYNTQTLNISYKGKNISEVLSLTVSEAIDFFHVYKNITSRLETLKEVGLDYIELGQSATTLSGGEAQRIKLASELSKRESGRTVYILDEPTTGLHFADLKRLLSVLKILVERGNTVIVVEHNLDVIKNADWIIDLGPEGGEKGGQIVAQGQPKDIIKNKSSYTGQFLKNSL